MKSIYERIMVAIRAFIKAHIVDEDPEEST